MIVNDIFILLLRIRICVVLFYFYSIRSAPISLFLDVLNIQMEVIAILLIIFGGRSTIVYTKWSYRSPPIMMLNIKPKMITFKHITQSHLNTCLFWYLYLEPHETLILPLFQNETYVWT